MTSPMACLFCGAGLTPESLMRDLRPRDSWLFKCPRCGDYEILQKSAGPIHLDAKKAAFMGSLRQRHEKGLPPLVFGDIATTIDGLIADTPQPQDPLDQMDLVLQHFSRHARGDLCAAVNAETDYPIAFTTNADDFMNLTRSLASEKFLEFRQGGSGTSRVQITRRGWEHARHLKKSHRETTQAFVAMAFHPSTDTAFTGGIKPALEATGYLPMRVDQVQHDGKICDVILAEIRRSALLVADFTQL